MFAEVEALTKVEVVCESSHLPVWCSTIHQRLSLPHLVGGTLLKYRNHDMMECFFPATEQLETVPISREFKRLYFRPLV